MTKIEKILIFSIFVLINFNLLEAQKLSVATIEPSTGLVSIGEHIEDIDHIRTNLFSSAYDQNSGFYFLIGSNQSDNQEYLIRVKSNSSEVISKSPFQEKDNFTDILFGLTYNNVSELLYAIYYDESEDLNSISIFDKDMGTYEFDQSLDGFRNVIISPILIDDLENRMLFRGLDEENGFRFFAVDLEKNNEAVRVETSETNNADNYIINTQIDKNTGIVYGLQWNSENEKWNFISIDYKSGSFTIINQIQPNIGVVTSPKLYTLDYTNGRYFFKGTNDLNEEKLYTIDIENGEIIHEVNFYTIGNIYTFFTELEYDNTEEKLYAIYVDGNITSSIQEAEVVNFSYFPNPVLNHLTILFFDQGDKEILISNGQGQAIYQMKTGKISNILDLSTFEKGIYFLTITSKNQIITRKIIKL